MDSCAMTVQTNEAKVNRSKKYTATETEILVSFVRDNKSTLFGPLTNSNTKTVIDQCWERVTEKNERGRSDDKVQ